MTQSNINKARVRDETCSLQYMLLHAYIAASPPMKDLSPKSKTAALPIYARLPRCKYLNGFATASSVKGMLFATRMSCCRASLLNFFPRYLPCWDATCAVYAKIVTKGMEHIQVDRRTAGKGVILLLISCSNKASSLRSRLSSLSESYR